MVGTPAAGRGGGVSSGVSRADDCDFYCEGWFSRGGSPDRLACPYSCKEV